MSQDFLRLLKLNDSYLGQLTGISAYGQIQQKMNSRGEGISVYTRDSIEVIEGKDVPRGNNELICLEVELPKSKPFITIA